MNYQLKRKRCLSCLGLVIISLCLLMACTQTTNSQTKSGSNKTELINQALTEIINDGKAPGMIAAIISGEGVIAISSAGERKARSGIAFTTNDVVHLGSCGKAMTSTMIATLVAEGKLSWDTKLIEAIPELKNRIHADYHKITLWQLLTHRAGIPKNPTDEGAFSSKEIKKRRLAILEDNFKSPATYEIDKFHYSNFGYIIAACMAEQITGLSWEVLMKKRLFDPLGMSTAGFGNPNISKSTAQPWGHHKYVWKWWHPSESYYEEAGGPAGRVHCSIADWAKFISLQLTEENSILDKEFLNKLIEPVGGHFYAGGWGVAEYAWAKGITLNHDGSNEIWYAVVLVTPKFDRAFVVATNSCDFGSTPSICTEIMNKLIRMELNLDNK
ncbi:MAG: beta-lactamase family protein [Gemmatimonadales bacterium]|nr:beta-lactamase family protein [Gemmatimonadales bacterium]